LAQLIYPQKQKNLGLNRFARIAWYALIGGSLLGSGALLYDHFGNPIDKKGETVQTERVKKGSLDALLEAEFVYPAHIQIREEKGDPVAYVLDIGDDTLHRFADTEPTHTVGKYLEFADEDRDCKFGSLQTAGPFPVQVTGGLQTWFFPRPADAQKSSSNEQTLFPVHQKPEEFSWINSLPSPLRYAVGNRLPPSKDSVESWWNEDAWNEWKQIFEYLFSTQNGYNHNLTINFVNIALPLKYS